MSKPSVIDRLEIRQAERRVWLDGQALPLRARAFDLLLALAERADRVVSKNELLALIWPDTIVEENNLTVQVSALRKVLGYDAVTTITGRGYRLCGRPGGLARQEPRASAAAPPPGARLQRRLAAIVQADVVDWPRLVAGDTAAALAAWRHLRVDLIEQALPGFGGRAIELTAERLQIEFASVVDAIAWSTELQAQLAGERSSAGPALQLRMGLTVDDVIVDDGRLVGDGVTLAADLQHSAGAGDVLVTEQVQRLVGNQLQVHFETLGERLMRRLRQPVQVHRVTALKAPGSSHRPRPGHRTRMASLAVLPFSSDAGEGAGDAQHYFGDGITEEIIATLSLNRALFVIAHGSTLRYRGPVVDLSDAANELGVRYLVTGSVRRLGGQVRIRVSLVHAPDRRTLWQAPYDGASSDLFGFLAEIAASVAAAIAPQVQDEEVARVRQRPTEHPDAYDCVLRGLAGLYQLGTAEFERAGDLFQRAIDLDPEYAQAHAHLAWWHSLRHLEGRSAPGDDDGRRALQHALLATRLDSRDAWALSVAAYLLTLLERRHQQALEMFDRALAINPSCAAAWARSAATLSYLGRTDEALERVQRAMHLSPFDQHAFWHLTICGGACFVGQRYAEAAGWLGKALQLNPHFNGARRVRIAALVRIGERAEAEALAQELLTEYPDFSVREFGRRTPMLPPFVDDLLDGLRQAGLPD